MHTPPRAPCVASPRTGAPRERGSRRAARGARAARVPRVPRGAVAGAGERLCAECTRALPWLRRGCPRCALPTHRGRPCPAGHAAFPRAWAPVAYEGVARQLVGRAEVPRGAARGGRDGGAHGREPAGVAARSRRRARARARRAAHAGAPGGSIRRACLTDALARRHGAPARRLPRAARPRPPPGRRRPQRPPRAGPHRRARARVATAAGAPRRRRPHHRRHAGRVRPRAREPTARQCSPRSAMRGRHAVAQEGP